MGDPYHQQAPPYDNINQHPQSPPQAHPADNKHNYDQGQHQQHYGPPGAGQQIPMQPQHSGPGGPGGPGGQQIPMHSGPGTPAAAQGFQTAVPIMALSQGPAPIDCPACGMRQMTRIEYENGNTTYAWALGLCLCFCLGCIPFCINSLKDVAHFCGHCGVRVATFHRSGHTEQHVHR